VMSVMLYSKQDQRELDMAMIGIMSRKRLMQEKAKVLLGREEESILKVDPQLQERIDGFILSSYKVSSSIQLK